MTDYQEIVKLQNETLDAQHKAMEAWKARAEKAEAAWADENRSAAGFLLRAEKAEAERDEWRQRCLGPVDDDEVSRVIESIQDVAKREVVVRLVRERDEARAQIAKEVEIHDLQHRLILRESEALASARADAARLREALEGIAEEFERTVRHIDSKGKGGQKVSFHGDFASACQLPSFCSSARWWATHLRAALKEDE